MRWLLFLLPILSNAQGIVKSHIIGADTSKVVLTARSFDNWDNPIEHEFLVGTVTYLEAGDHLLRYEIADTLVHSEWVHITSRKKGNRRALIEKWIWVSPPRLTEVNFVGKKRVP